MWIANSWSDTPVGGAEITIPAHYETTTPAPVITYSQNLGWNSSAVAAQAVSGDGYYSFRIDDTNTGAVVGLNTAMAAAGSSNYTDITHAIKTAANQYQVVESGTTKTTAASFTSADVFKVVFTALSVTYYKNATLIYTSLTALADVYLKLDCSLYEAGDKIYDAKFLNGQLTSGVFLDEYATLAALELAHPTGTSTEYATVLGIEYVWNGSAWVVGDAPIAYADLTALQTAHPTATLNDYASVAGVGEYVWNGAAWVLASFHTVGITTAFVSGDVAAVDTIVVTETGEHIFYLAGATLYHTHVKKLDLAIGNPLINELDLVLANPLIIELDLAIGNPIINELDLVISTLQTLKVELDLAVAVTQTLKVELDLAWAVSPYSTIKKVLDLAWVVEADYGKVFTEFVGEYATVGDLIADIPTATVNEYATVLGIIYIFDGVTWVGNKSNLVFANETPETPKFGQWIPYL
jgi:hypothetical protein